MIRNGRLACVVVLAVLASSAPGCSKPGAKPTLDSVEVSPSSAIVDSGQTQQFAAIAHWSDATTSPLSSGVTWRSANAAVATVDASGLATGAGTSTHTVAITATSEGKSGTASLSVVYDLKSIAIDAPSSPLPAGFDARLGVTGTWSGGVTVPLTGVVVWASSDEAIATVDPTGLAHGVAAGETTITAAYQGRTAQRALTVSSASLESIAVDPPAATLVAGRSVRLTASGAFSDAVTRPIVAGIAWSDDGSGHARVDATGLVTSAAPTSPGDTVVTATVGGRSADARITVSAAVVERVTVTAAATAPYQLAKGLSLPFAAEATLSDGTTQPLDGTGWSVTPPDGSVATVDANGLVVATGTGTATITYVDAASGLSGSAALTVTAPLAQALALSPAFGTTAIGQARQYVATATLSDGGTADVTSTVRWSTLSPGEPRARMSTPGLLTGLAPGSVTVRATDPATGLTAEATLLVYATLAYPGDVPLGAAVAGSSPAYEISGLTPGATYAVSLVGMSGDLDLRVYGDAAFDLVTCASSTAGIAVETCEVVAPASGAVSVLVAAGEGALAASFTLDVAPPGFGFHPVAVPGEVPHGGAVGTGATGFALTGLVPGTQYSVSLSWMSDDVNLLVYADAARANLLCSSSNASSTRDRCVATAPAGGVLYVVADGSATLAGAGFTLDVALAGPLGLEWTMLLWPADLPYAEQSAWGTGFYAVSGLTPGHRYTVAIPTMTEDVDLSVYADLALATELCSSAHLGTYGESCAATADASGALYVVASPYLTPADYTVAISY